MYEAPPIETECSTFGKREDSSDDDEDRDDDAHDSDEDWIGSPMMDIELDLPSDGELQKFMQELLQCDGALYRESVDDIIDVSPLSRSKQCSLNSTSSAVLLLYV